MTMFREMRRKRQEMTRQESDAVLRRGTSGVLALHGDDGYPYAVPISYVYDGARLFFHCAPEGHKIDAIRRNGKASFCVIDRDDVVPEKYTTRFRSVIVFGAIRILENEQEKREAIEKLVLKYAPLASADNRREAVDRDWKRLCMIELTVAHVTGKEGIELVREKASLSS